MVRALVPLLVVALTLVPTLAHADGPPEAPAHSRPIASSPDGHELVWPARTPELAVRHPILRRGHDMGLISTGIALLTLGTIVGVIIASFDLAVGNCHEFSFRTGTFHAHEECGTAPFALVPIVGSALVGTVGIHGSTDAGTIVPGVLALVPQIAGLIVLLVGVHGFTEDLISGQDGELAVRFAPYASDTSVGATLTVRM